MKNVAILQVWPFYTLCCFVHMHKKCCAYWRIDSYNSSSIAIASSTVQLYL